MAKKKNFELKDEYLKGKKILIRNKTLGKLIPVTAEQVVSMAKRGKLDKSQLQTMFKGQPKPEAPKEPEA